MERDVEIKNVKGETVFTVHFIEYKEPEAWETEVREGGINIEIFANFPATAGMTLDKLDHILRNFDGGMIIPPGTMIGVNGSAAQTSIAHIEFMYAEVPV